MGANHPSWAHISVAMTCVTDTRVPLLLMEPRVLRWKHLKLRGPDCPFKHPNSRVKNLMKAVTLLRA